MKKKTFITIVVLLLQVAAIQFLAAQPIGYASMDGWGQNGTTGGDGGPTVTVTNSSDLLDYISRDGPYIILIDGMISVPSGMHDITSNKTVQGVGSNSGIRGGGFNVGLPIDDGPTSPPSDAVYNVIIRNLIFEDANDDNLNVMMFSHHVWIDHNTFLSTSDGACDIKRGSQYVTVSYNHFRNINKTCLLGHDDDNGDQDRGRLWVTYHHNWFENCNQRQPRVRFAETHVFNNYWENPGSYCIGRGVEAKVYSENNHKDGGGDFSRDGGGGAVLDAGSIGGSSTNGGSVTWRPADRYSYKADPASEVESIVRANAGVGKVGDMPTPVPTEPGQTPDPTPEPTPTPTPIPGGTYEMQAEEAEWSSGGVESNHDGYTGSGYVNTDNASGEWIEWSVDVADASDATCVFRYACESGDRPMGLGINGDGAIIQLDFPATGAWTTWATETADVALIPGTNTIRLTATGSGGAPNMDKMDITIHDGEDPTPSPPPPLGDVNLDGSIDIVDALLVAQCYVGITECPSLELGDVDCDGGIDIIDALLIAQFYVGLIDQFCS